MPNIKSIGQKQQTTLRIESVRILLPRATAQYESSKQQQRLSEDARPDAKALKQARKPKEGDRDKVMVKIRRRRQTPPLHNMSLNWKFVELSAHDIDRQRP